MIDILNLLRVYAVFCGMLVFASCYFHIAYLNSAAPPVAWLILLRYVAATAAAALAFPGVLYLATRRAAVRKAALWLAGIITYYCLTVLIGDLAYYRQAGKHSTIELMLFYQNFVDIALMGMRDYAYIPVLYLVTGVGFFWFWKKLVRWEDSHHPVARGNVALWKRISSFSIFVILNIIAFRGGVQGRPLRPADAFVYLNQAHGDFALNGVYTSFYAVFHRSGFPVVGDAESIRAVQNLIGSKNEIFPSAEMPFYRLTKPAGEPKKKNIVFILLESWSAKRVGAYGDKMGATPFFDSLAQKSWLFTNAYATGRRSIASLPSAVSSIPTLYGSLYITSPHEQNFQRGMGAILREQGYTTMFTYAAKAGSMGFNAFARLAGFDKILTRESFPAEAAHDGVWGIYDHVTFARTLEEIDAARKPVLSVVYTLHPHPPFTLPAGNDFFSEGADGERRRTTRAKYYNALRYADNSLRDFFVQAEKKPWFADTVFVLMADHAFEEKQGRDSFRIPLLVYSPGFVPAQKDERIVSELDVLPTLIDLLQLKTAHASMGKSALAGGERFAYIDVEHAGGVITRQGERELVLLFGAEKFAGYYDMSADPEWHKTRAEPPLSAAQMHAYRSYVGVMGYAVAKNRIAPSGK